MEYLRSICVLCSSKLLTSIYTKENVPSCIFSTSELFSSDTFTTFELLGCENCNCVQMKYLTDPTLLYRETHNITYNTPTWAKHHREFSKFIISDIQSPELFIEIGGQSGVLAKEILSSFSTPYTILDLCENPPVIEGISYVNTNCETYSYPSNSIVILSHVFEHLYNPIEFIKRLSMSKIKTVFISIPNMDVWLSTNVLSFIHVEHTFYCDSFYIVDAFSRHGYTCTKQQNFLNHSVFYRFDIDDTKVYVQPPVYPNTIERFKSYLLERDTKVSSIEVHDTTFIFPAGHYGQLIYNTIKGDKTKIISFLDNDPSKVGLRVYGTECTTQIPSVLNKFIDSPVSVIVCASVYREEIKAQLYSINPNITIIDV